MPGCVSVKSYLQKKHITAKYSDILSVPKKYRVIVVGNATYDGSPHRIGVQKYSKSTLMATGIMSPVGTDSVFVSDIDFIIGVTVNIDGSNSTDKSTAIGSAISGGIVGFEHSNHYSIKVILYNREDIKNVGLKNIVKNIKNVGGSFLITNLNQQIADNIKNVTFLHDAEGGSKGTIVGIAEGVVRTYEQELYMTFGNQDKNEAIVDVIEVHTGRSEAAIVEQALLRFVVDMQKAEMF